MKEKIKLAITAEKTETLEKNDKSLIPKLLVLGG